jgi:hypothetical protein
MVLRTGVRSHVSVRTDDAQRTMVYFVVLTGMANARVPPLAPSRNESPGLPRPPRRWPGLFSASNLASWAAFVIPTC